MKLIIYGAGYVGCVTAACCAKMGHDVVLTDTNEIKIDCLRAGVSPVLEPGLQELIAAAAAEGRLKAQLAGTEGEAGLVDADMAIVCVGTPSRRDGTTDTQALRRVFQAIAVGALRRQESLTVVVRSTALAPLLRRILAEVEPREGAEKIRLVISPEFLRETTAISDFFSPPFLVAGGDDPEAVSRALSLFEGISAPRFGTTLETASLLKYGCNAFHALKMAFANEIDALAAMVGADGKEVMRLLAQDKILNISPAYLRPGAAFGGSCLPKDVRALEALAGENHQALPLISAILPSNRRRLELALETISTGTARRLGFVGLSFKVGSDDLRESPYVELAERLIGRGFTIKVFDPDLDPKRFLGANKERALKPPLHLVSVLVDSLAEACAEAEAVVVCKDIMAPEALRAAVPEGTVVYDLNRMAYSAKTDDSAGFNIPTDPPNLLWSPQSPAPSAAYLS